MRDKGHKLKGEGSMWLKKKNSPGGQPSTGAGIAQRGCVVSIREDFQDPTGQSHEQPRLNSILTSLWSGGWTRGLLRSESLILWLTPCPKSEAAAFLGVCFINLQSLCLVPSTAQLFLILFHACSLHCPSYKSGLIWWESPNSDHVGLDSEPRPCSETE